MLRIDIPFNASDYDTDEEAAIAWEIGCEEAQQEYAELGDCYRSFQAGTPAARLLECYGPEILGRVVIGNWIPPYGGQFNQCA